ncbi:MAG: RluA family pseudouridine synthase [Desulfobulbaceae bacterium]|uniref:RluA family pseudouridine synthase n=1 Tax=Candidatus Desulfatifera sulfidica TaxID=2841691 RepID=A0A8J6NBT7_9BACT|nr:RluA family pseudouridine synthase [Candidatus Desulfatifera sulfidica]
MNTLKLSIIHAEDTFIVIDKPSGLLAVPGRGPEMQDCVVSRLKQDFTGLPDQPAVHRLDMDTSGLMVVARTPAAHRELSRQFEHRSVNKEYIALLDGLLPDNRGTAGKISLKFRLDPDNRPHQIYDPIQGKTGITHWQKLGNEKNCTRICFQPITGRTHQLRLHAAHELGLGLPIVGDRLYGHGTAPGQLLLHASSLSFIHPENGQTVNFTSALRF